MRVEIQPLVLDLDDVRVDLPLDLAHADLDGAEALDHHVLEHAGLLDVQVLVVGNVAQGVGGRVGVLVVLLRPRVSLGVGARLALQAAQPLDLGLDEVFRRDRLLALLQRRDFRWP
jgi:hypothetical protein